MRTYRLFIISNEYTPPGKEEFTFSDFIALTHQETLPEEMSVYTLVVEKGYCPPAGIHSSDFALQYLYGRAFCDSWCEAGTYTRFDVHET
jgi:hypothetical protein